MCSSVLVLPATVCACVNRPSVRTHIHRMKRGQWYSLHTSTHVHVQFVNLQNIYSTVMTAPTHAEHDHCTCTVCTYSEHVLSKNIDNTCTQFILVSSSSTCSTVHEQVQYTYTLQHRCVDYCRTYMYCLQSGTKIKISPPYRL